MQANPLVSIIIPVYNKESCIKDTLLSVLSQTYKNFEILVIDDGSKDRSRAIIEEIAINDGRCRYHYKENGGVSSARNYGIDLASGGFISFLDADDFYDEDFLRRMLSCSGNVDYVYCGHLVSNSITGTVQKAKMKFFTKDFLMDYLLNKSTPHTNSWLIKKDLINSNSIRFNESLTWGEDMLFFSTVALVSDSYRACPHYLTKYVMYNENSLTTSQDYERKIKMDFHWLGILERNILNSVKNTRRYDYVAAICEYRRPASVIYNLAAMLDSVGVVEVKDSFSKYKDDISSLSFINGLRSLKLYICRFYLYFKTFGK